MNIMKEALKNYKPYDSTKYTFTENVKIILAVAKIVERDFYDKELLHLSICPKNIFVKTPDDVILLDPDSTFRYEMFDNPTYELYEKVRCAVNNAVVNNNHKSVHPDLFNAKYTAKLRDITSYVDTYAIVLLLYNAITGKYPDSCYCHNELTNDVKGINANDFTKRLVLELFREFFDFHYRRNRELCLEEVIFRLKEILRVNRFPIKSVTIINGAPSSNHRHYNPTNSLNDGGLVDVSLLINIYC